MEQKLFERLDQGYDEMVEIRRYLHQYPELSFEEEETPAYIADYHRRLGHEVHTGVGGRGVTARLEGAHPGPVIALRADFDALPIQEETGLPFASKRDGVMHACGHDGHTAEMLVLAKALNQLQDELSGTIVFIHQHAEELAPGGAQAMIEDGCLDGVDVIFGTHLWATVPYGVMQYKDEAMMAAADSFDINIIGRGGHGATPHLTKDAIVIGSQLVTTIQQLVSRRIDPQESAVVSVGSFEAANAFNVIADQARLVGTVRTFNDDVRDSIEEELNRMTKGVCDSAGAEADFCYFRGYPAVVNHTREADFLASCAAEVPGVTETEYMKPQMTGEDFAYYLHHVKGSYFFTGAGHPEWEKTYPHHHPKFDIDERAMLIAAKILGKAVLDYEPA
ncbi:M20 family metallopeptidase [Salibacterium qingdaonense]|uniref:Amidohydrolase n=1 Tax=Salibacterium qingdaonense TaxID=266892 RepID=A0A1I4JCP4_9BACI|nr:M20 family metallopeptidase [Salibacterium qingdaonense]SFL63953.1 amidohydrolase [Salibacterium qingdaonense]